MKARGRAVSSVQFMVFSMKMRGRAVSSVQFRVFTTKVRGRGQLVQYSLGYSQ